MNNTEIYTSIYKYWRLKQEATAILKTIQWDEELEKEYNKFILSCSLEIKKLEQ